MEFIESPLFTKLVYAYLNEGEYLAMQWELSLHPESGSLIPETGGLRKLRWQSKGKGKRGGVRIIYYYKKSPNQIWLLTIYGKNEVESLPKALLKKIREELVS